MAVSEAQLETWSHQGSEAQSASTYQAVKNVLNDSNSPYYPKSFEIFLQGSYDNKTNIYADSDVDIVIRLDSIYYSDTRNLSAADKQNYETNFSKANYTLAMFKQEVFEWLRLNFGQGVKLGEKAVKIPGSGNRRDADVLVCAKHQTYYTYPIIGTPTTMAFMPVRPSFRISSRGWLLPSISSWSRRHSRLCARSVGGAS